MRLLVVGTADAFSTERFGSSAMVEGAQGRVLIDCPDMIGAALRKAREASGWDVDVLSVTDIVLTHLHGDHCNGLESLGFRRWLQREADGHPLPREHGGPCRMITPKLYAWKGTKWIRKIDFLSANQPGFWEQRGYSDTAEPWLEDRYS